MEHDAGYNEDEGQGEWLDEGDFDQDEDNEVQEYEVREDFGFFGDENLCGQ